MPLTEKLTFKRFANLEQELYYYSIVRNIEALRLSILGFFPGPTALLKALRLLNFGIFPRVYRYFQV